jgi:hypothetical protein
MKKNQKIVPTSSVILSQWELEFSLQQVVSEPFFPAAW